MAVSSAGVITATATAEIDGATYILEPTYVPTTSELTWEVGSTSTCLGGSSGLILCKP